MADLLRRFCRDDSGQDIVEYAFLALFVSLAGLAMWSGVAGLLGEHYEFVNDGVQDLWEPPPLGGS